ncbi:MAG: histidine kinase [Anaerocolumna sp.]
MFRRNMNVSFRRQLIALSTLCIILVMVTQVYYIVRIFQRNYEQNMVSCESMITQTDTQLTQMTERISKIGKTVSNNIYVQELLRLNNQGKKGTVKRRREIQDLITNYLQGITSSNEEMYDIAIIDNNNYIFSSNRYFDYYVYSKMEQKYDFINMQNAFFTTFFQSNTLEMYNYGFGYVVPVYYTTGAFSDIHERLGTCIVWNKKKALNEIAQSTTVTEEATVLIVDDQVNIMAVNSVYDEEVLTAEINAFRSTKGEGSLKGGLIHEMEFMGRNSFILMKEHGVTGWKTINIVPVKSVYKEALSTLYLGLFLAAGAIMILVIFNVLMVYSISKPIKHITSVLDTIGKGKRRQRVDYIAKNEFGVISKSINTMLDNVEVMNRRIFDMQSELYEKELMQKEAEMLALQSQINPHFLYNTLECIRSIATIHKIAEISTITTSMSRIFRYSIKGGLITTIQEELDCIKDYCKIITVRYNGRLKVDFEVEEEVYPYTALKMFMQPIIENSVYHGLEATEGEVWIRIKGWREEEYVLFTITDNGAGMEPEKVEELNHFFLNATREDVEKVSKSKSSIGLANINMRIRLNYGPESGLRIQSTKQEGTKVFVKMKIEK